jgi:hypothetical protein
MREVYNALDILIIHIHKLMLLISAIYKTKRFGCLLLVPML